MKPLIGILIAGVIAGAFIAGSLYGHFKPKAPVPQQITLEKILSIKELHLVKHTYSDLFFLHRHNNPGKTVRAIVQIPVHITAYLDLKEIEFIRHGDSIRQLVLPRARLHDPQYRVDQLVVRGTRHWHWHVGKDLYPEVSSYLQSAIIGRMDTIRNMAVSRRILIQAEEEGKEYVQSLLAELGRADILVSFKDEGMGNVLIPPSAQISSSAVISKVQSIPFGFVLWP